MRWNCCFVPPAVQNIVQFTTIEILTFERVGKANVLLCLNLSSLLLQLNGLSAVCGECHSFFWEAAAAVRLSFTAALWRLSASNNTRCNCLSWISSPHPRRSSLCSNPKAVFMHVQEGKVQAWMATLCQGQVGEISCGSFGKGGWGCWTSEEEWPRVSGHSCADPSLSLSLHSSLPGS